MRNLAHVGLAVLAAAGFGFVVAVASSGDAMAQARSPLAAAQDTSTIKQMVLTEKQVQGVLAAQKDMDAITSKLPDEASDKPDPKAQAQLDSVAGKYGFANYSEYSDVVDNISLVLSGIDPKTKTFSQPPEALKKQIAMIQADTKMPAKDKKAALDEMNAVLKTTPTVQHQENVALVIKHYDKLSAALQEDQ